MNGRGDLSGELPAWSVTRWLVEPGGDVPDSTRRTLLHSLYSTLPIFAGGVLNTIAVSAVVAARMQTTAAYIWVALEVLLAALRLPTLYRGRRAMREGRRGPTDIYITLAVLWAASVGYGTFMCVVSGDWVAAALACLSAAAMVGGICFRNYGAPRLVAVMIALSLGPCVIAGVLSGQPILLLTLFQIPFYLVSMSAAAFQLNRLLVRTMRAEMINDHHARHDPLTGLLNRNGLSRWAGEHAARAEAGQAVLYLDLDWFKTINDTLGHKAGDAVLVAVGKRLREVGGAHVRVARIGGDEFVLVAPNVDRAGAEQLKARIGEAVAGQPYLVEGQNVYVGASIGVALSDDHLGTLAELIDAADMALHQAKSANRAARLALGRGGAAPTTRRAALKMVHRHAN